jgi:hypothetical protein
MGLAGWGNYFSDRSCFYHHLRRGSTGLGRSPICPPAIKDSPVTCVLRPNTRNISLPAGWLVTCLERDMHNASRPACSVLSTPSLIWALSVLLAFIFTSGRSVAQATAGVLQVQVTDPSGAFIPGAVVTTTSSNGEIKNATTDLEGGARVNSLSPGSYTVRIVSPGFGPFQSSLVTIAAGRTETLNVRLQIQREADRITVSDDAQAPLN